MRAMQTFGGIVLLLIGVLLLSFTTGLIQMTWLDLAGLALALSGLLFWIPGIVFRKQIPALTFLFIPGTLAFAIGGILVYTERAGFASWAYLWTILIIAVGLAFLAIYWLGPRARWLKFVGSIIGGLGVLLFAFFTTTLSAEPSMRVVGSIGLIAFGLLFAFGALTRKR